MLKSIFNKMDSEKNGFLSAERFASVIRSLKCEISQENAQECMEKLDGLTTPVTLEKLRLWYAKDPSLDGVWLAALRAVVVERLEAKARTDAKLRGIFDKMDSDRAGTLDFKKIASAAKGLGCEVSQDNAKDCLVALDCLQGPVTYEKFYGWYASESSVHDAAKDGVWLTALRAMMAKRMNVAPPPIPPEHAAKLRGLFDKLDSDKTGTLDVKKIASVMKGLGCEMSQENAKYAIEALDGIPVTFDKFCVWYLSDPGKDGVWLTALRVVAVKRMGDRSKSNPPPSSVDPDATKILRAIFDKINSDKSGALTVKQIATVVKSMGCEMSQENAKDAMEALDGITEPVTFEKFSVWHGSDPANDGAWLKALRAKIVAGAPARSKTEVR